MCIILHCENDRPGTVELRRLARTNPDGAGIAYKTTPDSQSVTWHKGLTTDEAVTLAEKAPLPFALHFRIATHGGTSAKLTHPFPVTDNVGLNLDGHAKMVVFHNGIWNGFKNFETHTEHLRGPSSDSRIIAWVLNKAGTKNRPAIAKKIALEAGRLLVVGDEGITRYGTGWVKGRGGRDGTTEGVWYSNNTCSFSTTVGSHYGYTGGRAKTQRNYWDIGTGHNNIHNLTPTLKTKRPIKPATKLKAFKEVKENQEVIAAKQDENWWDFTPDFLEDNQPSVDQLNEGQIDALEEQTIESVYQCCSCNEYFPMNELHERYNGHTTLSEQILCEDCGELFSSIPEYSGLLPV